MAEHTPTPWYLFDDDAVLPGIEGADDTSVIVYGANEPGDEAGVHGKTPDHARANAALIVTAVNAWNDISALLARVAELQRDLPMTAEQAEDISKRST